MNYDYALKWTDHDPDPVTAQQVRDWIDADDTAALDAAFAGPLAFGTAGLRAAVGAGESRMNRAVVIRTTFGLISWLKQQTSEPVVVIGCDARHGSAQFQRDAAEVISAAGGRALLLPAQNPTPLTAFAVKHYDADCGIMVTASHNPPADNGYKVYLGGRAASANGNGVQIIPPVDSQIAAAIAAAPA
ncbi:MAG: phospho-sugar mutase, partial [Corynebacterium camporealensis]|nr:phospho-sugar mutase [Corynebacterium camporealensis]